MALDDPALVVPITKFRKSLLAFGIKKNAQNAHRGRNKPGIMLLLTGADGPLEMQWSCARAVPTTWGK